MVCKPGKVGVASSSPGSGQMAVHQPVPGLCGELATWDRQLRRVSREIYFRMPSANPELRQLLDHGRRVAAKQLLDQSRSRARSGAEAQAGLLEYRALGGTLQLPGGIRCRP